MKIHRKQIIEESQSGRMPIITVVSMGKLKYCSNYHGYYEVIYSRTRN